MPSYPSSSGSASIEILPDSPNRFYYQPPCEESLSNYADLAPQCSEAVHVHGRVRVRVKEARLVKQLLVRFKAAYQLDIPHRRREEGTLLERTLLFGDGHHLSLEAGDNYFDYLFVLSNHLPPVTRCPWGRISYRIEAQVNGLPSARFVNFFRSGTPSSPSDPQLSPSPEDHLMELCSSPPSFFSTVSPRRQTRPSFSSVNTSSTISSCQSFASSTSARDATQGGSRWLTGTLVTYKPVYMIPITSSDPTSLVLEHIARPPIPDLALWPWSLHSPRLSVGGAVDFDCTMVGGHPLARVHMVKLHLCETTVLTSPEQPDAPLTLLPLAFLLASKGELPGKQSRVLWEGPDVPVQTGVGCGELSFEKQCKLPDEIRMQRSTLPGTITPIQVKHEFRLKVFFDIWGEDLYGNPLPTGSGPGAMRLATMTHPVIISACCTTRLQLPTYGEATSPITPPRVAKETYGPLCACGNVIDAEGAAETARLDDAARLGGGSLGLQLGEERPKPARWTSSNASGKWEYEAAYSRI